MRNFIKMTSLSALISSLISCGVTTFEVPQKDSVAVETATPNQQRNEGESGSVALAFQNPFTPEEMSQAQESADTTSTAEERDQIIDPVGNPNFELRCEDDRQHSLDSSDDQVILPQAFAVLKIELEDSESGEVNFQKLPFYCEKRAYLTVKDLLYSRRYRMTAVLTGAYTEYSGSLHWFSPGQDDLNLVLKKRRLTGNANINVIIEGSDNNTAKLTCLFFNASNNDECYATLIASEPGKVNGTHVCSPIANQVGDASEVTSCTIELKVAGIYEVRRSTGACANGNGFEHLGVNLGEEYEVVFERCPVYTP